MIVKAWGNLRTMRGFQSLALLAQLWQSERGLGFAMRLGQAMDQLPDHTPDTVHQTLILVFQRCQSLLGLNRAMAWLLEEAPAPWPSLLGEGHAGLILLCCTTRLALSAGREERLCEVSPALLHRMARVCLPSGMRRDCLDGFGAAVRVIGEGGSDRQSERVSFFQTFPGILPMLRRRFMGHQDAGMLSLHHQHTLVRSHRVVAVNRTRRCRREGEQWPKHLLLGRPRRAHGIHPSCDRGLAHGHQEQRGKETRNMPETDAAHHRQRAGQPDQALTHRLGCRDTLDVRCEGHPLVLGVQGIPLRDDASIGYRMVACRPCMHIDVGDVLTPTDRRSRPSRTLQGTLAQIALDNRRALFDRRADQGVLGHLCDSRRKLPRHGHRHPTPFAITHLSLDTVRRGELEGVTLDKRLTYRPTTTPPPCSRREYFMLPQKAGRAWHCGMHASRLA